MSKYDRLLFILNLLRSRRNLNAASLAKECDVTERSIYRDLIALSEANVPIYYDRGYKMATDNFLPPLNFNLDEYTCLKLMIDSSPLKSTAKYRKIIKELSAKIEANLSQAVKEGKKRSQKNLQVDIVTSHNSESVEKWFSIIEEAIENSNALDIDYDSLASGVTSRRVEPYFIVFRGRSFYFVAYCTNRKEFRTFRIDRVIGISTTGARFNRQKGINADSYFEGSWEIYQGKSVEVVVRLTGTAAKVVQSATHHANESVLAHGKNEVLYTVTVSGLQEIQRWILGFGSEASVVSPPELVDNLRNVGRHLSFTYPEKKKPPRQ
ncbi:MAG: YafY family protein [candidate division Zixibacteria bacterium]|nr:YafY family protein [candidate division Zixibacteria bacterium]